MDPKFKDNLNCIKLYHNLYGYKQASKNWHSHINTGLYKQGFTPPLVDSYLWLQKYCMICLYVDDNIILVHDQSVINGFINSMQKRRYFLQDKEDSQNYLDVNIITNNNNNYEMKQTGLIKDIIHDLNLDHLSRKYKFHKIPAIEVLQADLDKSVFCKE